MIAKYDEYIAVYTDYADHLQLLTEQRDGIKSALSEVEKELFKRKSLYSD
jgi:hypothetical protein